MKYAGHIISMAVVCCGLAGCGGLTESASKVEAHQQWRNTRADILVTKGEQQFNAGDLNGAGGSAREALALSPGHTAAQHLLTRVHIEQGEFARAMTVLDDMAAADPRAADIPYLQAVVHERRGRYDLALRLYEKARALDPDNPASVMASAEVLVAMGRPSEALGLVESKLVGMVESAGVYAFAGDLAMTVDLPADAAAYFRKARNLAPDRLEILERLAKAHFFAADYDLASICLRQLVEYEKYERAAWTHRMIGDSLMAMDQPRQAKTAYETATNLAAQDEIHWTKLAVASLACGDLPRAALSARRALHLNPTSTEAGVVLGYTLLAQGKAAEAEVVLERVERAQPEDPLVKCLLGRRHGLGGDAQTADAYYRAALQLDPDSAMARALLAAAQPDRSAP